MNLSLRNRVAASFAIANAAVLILAFIVFHFLNTHNKEIQEVMDQNRQTSVLTDEMRISAVSILKQQRKLLTGKGGEATVERLVDLCDGYLSQLQSLETLYESTDIKKNIAEMGGYVNSLKIVLSKAAFYRDSSGLASIRDLSDKILEAYSQFQDIQYEQNEEQVRKIREIISETKRNMMITLIIGFLGTIILGLIVPGKIALPFKKINDAIREIQECNFDVSIYYTQDDEIGEMASEMNKMIHNMKKFEELRSDRINVETRKFDVLANLVKKPVLVANAEGKLIYMNSQLYEILQVKSDDVIYKDMNDTILPPSIIESYDLAIKRRSKIENSEILIERKVTKENEAGEEVEADEITFKGFANVIPIRGKESSLDYYLMVMSEEIFV